MAKIAFISDLRQVILTEYFPHAIEFLNRPYAQIFPILTAYDELANYLSPLWMPGKAEHKTSYKDKLPRQRFHSLA